jgi:hypothetical protein
LENVIILTDSLATLQTLKAQEITSKTNWYALHIKQLLHQRKKNIRALVWIPGHTGITHNEEVDILAKEAAKMKSITIYAIPPQDQRCVIKREIMKEWQNIWEQSYQHLSSITKKSNRIWAQNRGTINTNFLEQ